MIWSDVPARRPWYAAPTTDRPPASPPTSPSVHTAAGPPLHVPSLPVKSSRNALFDLDWAPMTPNTRSRSSTVGSGTSSSSAGDAGEAGVTRQPSRRSWMDIDPPSELPAPSAPPFERRETITGLQEATPVLGSKHESGFAWLPQSPVSPERHSFVVPRSTSPPPMPPLPSATSGPVTPPRGLSRQSQPVFPPTPVSPIRPASRPSPVAFPSSEALPPTAGHSANPLLDTRRAPSLRMSPSPPYLLGEGRHATVYLASCELRAPTGTEAVAEKQIRRRRLCAAKRLFPDRESQIAGLGEAFILGKLLTPENTTGGAQAAEATNIIKLYGVRDERDGVDPPAPLASEGSLRASQRLSYPGARSVPSPLRRTSGDEERATEPATEGAPANAEGTGGPHRREMRPSRGSGRSKLSLLSNALEPPLSSSRRRTVSSPGEQQSAPAGPGQGGLAPAFSPSPRIDLLLEYCPFGHVLSFARAYPERLDKACWFKWARQVTGAVRWVHEKNVLHADIKPQNVMIAPDLTIRLADWGNSLFLPPSDAPAHLWPTDPHGLGTPTYAPPEYVRPLPSPFSYSSDIFSLGITLHVLLTAVEPYEGLRAMERMMRVADGDWWEFEDRRRLGLIASEGEEEGYALSRSSSVKSTRSGRSSVRGSLRASLRRESSQESVRSFMSVSGIGEQGPRDWSALAKTLLVDTDTSSDDLNAAVAAAMPSLPEVAAPADSTAMQTDAAPPGDAATFASRPSTTRYYPGTSTPLQYFLSAPTDDYLNEAGEPICATDHVVPLAVRDLIRQMTRPREDERPTAESVHQQICQIGRTEGIWT